MATSAQLREQIAAGRLITGLGAFAAVLMLIFKDTILGFVAVH